MQGKKQYLERPIPSFRLSERVPKHNLYRRLDELLDLSFLYDATAELYSHTGQPSLDPVVFFKLLLVGRLENLVSDRRLLEHRAMRLDILLFLGYGLDEELPWHSTVSRTRQLYPPALFEQLFDRVFALCVAQGLVAGDTQAVDSAPVKANAALESLQPKQPAEASTAAPHAAAVLSVPAHQLRNEAARQAKRQAAPGAPGASHPKARLLSNKTHYSTTDPDARVSVKPGKVRALNYLCSLAVDTAAGVISHVQADFADSRDSLHLPGIVRQLLPRLRAQGLLWRDVLADAGYANGFNYALLEEWGLTGWILVFGQYKPQVEGFRYDLATDTYTCAAGKPLPFQKYDTTADGGWLKIYWAAYQDCKQCPLKPTCAPTARRKQLTRTAYDPPYRRAWARQQSRQGQAMRRRRQSTVEPVFGNLIHLYGLRRVNTRSRASAHKTMLLAAVAYNLKKLLATAPAGGGHAAGLALPPAFQHVLAWEAPIGCIEKVTSCPA
ncbi:IS1182 family transposase [Hymenobacter sp. CRA2]|uniref:IS1182 family transposase n=1 Tax=Hymenobacter sp. CRA2 TaxID=1955620 RepID=UPI00098F8822|nr:IS1182 family transposase [Hymenobacter sp. CRA2]OON65280.1 hypothetical protein B0919_24455 [Hymenobacter sp. CRA2]